MGKNHSSFPLRLAIVGLGSAGRSRLKALAHTEGLALAGIVSRRPKFATLSWEEALTKPEIDAVAISTENTGHAARVQEALLAGKHVLCDYPLATRAGESETLFSLAQKQGRLLHVEHIGLLAEEHQALKEQAKVMGQVLQGEYLFQGGWNPKLEDESSTGPLALLALPRLLQIADLFGEFEIESSRLQSFSPGFSLHLHLKFPEGDTLGFTEERLPGLPRRRSLLARGTHGSIAWRSGTLTGGLFGKDLAWFRDRVALGKPCYYSEALMRRILERLLQGDISMQSP